MRTQSSFDILNWSIVLVCLLAIVASLFMGWQSLQAENHTVESTGSTKVGEPNVPTLKLNKVHQRQGEEVRVDAESIGKENPFK